jgi:hypothetical protein
VDKIDVLCADIGEEFGAKRDLWTSFRVEIIMHAAKRFGFVGYYALAWHGEFSGRVPVAGRLGIPHLIEENRIRPELQRAIDVPLLDFAPFLLALVSDGKQA